MNEFELIERIVSGAQRKDDTVLLGPGDDAAILDPGGRAIVVSTDTLNAGVHFLASDNPADVGYKALAVSLSDMAAMGARPRWALLSLTLPTPDSAWVDSFMEGFAGLADTCDVVLVGGDTTSGQLATTVTVIGQQVAGKSLTRDGAQPGDAVMVSGIPGMAALALCQRARRDPPHPLCLERLLRPAPRLQVSKSLLPLATACIDISDGLLADLGHIAKRSGCGATVRLEDLPRHDCFAGLSDARRFELQLTGGDDYELCFTVPAEHVAMVEKIAPDLGVSITLIGTMGGEKSVRCIDAEGTEIHIATKGFDHFGD